MSQFLRVDRREQLVALCRWHSVLTLAELGVLRGRMTKALLRGLPEVTIWAVDTWMSGDPALDPGPEVERRSSDDTGYRSYADVDMEQAYQGLQQLAEHHAGRLHLLRMTTLEGAKFFPDGMLDAIFLDADHQTEAVKADLRAWVPKLHVHRGVVFGHDFSFASVNQALNEVLPGWNHHHAGIWSITRREIDLELLG